jgi:hypothetical protein
MHAMKGSCAMKRTVCLSLAVWVMLCCVASAQVADAPDEVKAGIPVNYTESRVGSYTFF